MGAGTTTLSGHHQATSGAQQGFTWTKILFSRTVRAPRIGRTLDKEVATRLGQVMRPKVCLPTLPFLI